jgi:hypothetical protein
MVRWIRENRRIVCWWRLLKVGLFQMRFRLLWREAGAVFATSRVCFNLDASFLSLSLSTSKIMDCVLYDECIAAIILRLPWNRQHLSATFIQTRPKIFDALDGTDDLEPQTQRTLLHHTRREDLFSTQVFHVRECQLVSMKTHYQQRAANQNQKF